MGIVSILKYLSILLTTLVISGLSLSITLPLVKLNKGEFGFFTKKNLNDSSTKDDTEEEDPNEEETEREEDSWEEETILTINTFINLLLPTIENRLFYHANLLYDCIYVNQILTPPKLNV